MRKTQQSLDFEIFPIAPRRRLELSATKYWLDLELPGCMTDLSMTQLTALRRMVVSAFNAGRRSA